MRRSVDVLRSVKRYLATAMPDYEVRLSSEEGTWQRPFARVEWSTPATLTALGPFQIECRRTLNVVAWPLESSSADQARADAEDVVEILTQAFSVGMHTASFHGRRAHPLRIPIWDYSGVPINGTVDEVADRDPTDFASIVEPPVPGDIEDPNTELSRLVLCDLRLRWMRSIAVPDSSPVVQDVTAQVDSHLHVPFNLPMGLTT